MTLNSHDRESLKRILDLSDRLGSMRRTAKSISRSERAKKIREIAGQVVSTGVPGVLGRLTEEHRLSPQEVLVVLVLLHKRIESETRSLTGRQLLTLLFPSSWRVLTATSLLGRNSALIESGAVVAEEAGLRDVLETRYHLGEKLYRAVREDVRPRREELEKASPYRSHYEHLAELGALTSLLLRRSNALFEVDPFGHRAFDDLEEPGILDEQARSLNARINERLALTEDADRYPLVRLSRRKKLSRDEQLVLVSLLVQECYYGNPGLEAVDCVKMVSRCPEELLRKRSLMDSRGNLVGEGLVDLSDPVDDRELSAEVTLPRWLVLDLLGEGAPAGPRPIGPDTRLEFHEYLKRLGDSDQFYRDLEG